MPQRANPGEQPGSARHSWRAGLPGALAPAPGPEQANTPASVAGSRRCNSSRIVRAPHAGFRVTEQNAPRWHPSASAGRDSASHRVSSGAGALAFRGGDREQAGPAFPSVDRRLADRLAAPTSAARHDRLELRPPERRRASRFPAAGRLRGRPHIGIGTSGRQRRPA